MVIFVGKVGRTVLYNCNFGNQLSNLLCVCVYACLIFFQINLCYSITKYCIWKSNSHLGNLPISKHLGEFKSLLLYLCMMKNSQVILEWLEMGGLLLMIYSRPCPKRLFCKCHFHNVFSNATSIPRVCFYQSAGLFAISWFAWLLTFFFLSGLHDQTSLEMWTTLTTMK